ncbi:microprocessor complex subunit DGCR8 isoform X1 [Bombyx mandarina]|uniref:Microprocessor complex subunit DGCR8 isoform X1 n=1 Tax=Bombyx mandarina TaxID=7092 RepID=A0A6J2JW32_BOMMA|nr:microprocessor complex subunit DGCR8 isoform X1 [Bombyx mandarina]
MNEEDQHLPPAKKPKVDNSVEDVDFTQDVSIVDNNKDFKISTDKYTDYVTPTELQQLREFKVLDEVKSNEEDSNDEDTESTEGKSEGVPEDEIEKMLDEDLPEGFKGAPKPKEKAYVMGKKIVLEDKGANHFEVLPLDWMMVRHYSGMPVYMHRSTRVCTLSKPYFLGKGNIRRHDIPISAIPCLAYRKYLEEEEKQKEIDNKIQEQIRNGTWNTAHSDAASEPPVPRCPFAATSATTGDPADNAATGDTTSSATTGVTTGDTTSSATNDGITGDTTSSATTGATTGDTASSVTTGGATGDTINSGGSVSRQENDDGIPANRKPVVLPGGIVMPPPRVETVSTSWKTQHLTHEQVNEYCAKLFKFKTVNIMLFKRWADKRKYTKARKALQYPALPEGTKLIAIPAQHGAHDAEGGKSTKRDWVMNMDGRSYLAVFHEYVGRALQKQPVYEFKQLENAATPYQATVYIGGMQYGVGRGSSKRQAKSAAARASIHILIPEMKDELDGRRRDADPDFTFFDYVGIEDPRIAEFCAATCEPSPHAILRTCLLRNFGAGDRHVHTEMKKFENQKIELTMKVGKHTATVVCKNKKTAKQRASQSILQALHPHVRSWGSLLRLYGSRSVKSCKEKKLEEQQITLLQDKARHNEPNYAVLEKLRNEMRKLRERDAAVVPIGTLLLADDLPSHSASNLNNVEL